MEVGRNTSALRDVLDVESSYVHVWTESCEVIDRQRRGLECADESSMSSTTYEKVHKECVLKKGVWVDMRERSSTVWTRG